MCGIIYCESFKGKPVNQLVMQQFKAQRSRGVQGFGLYDKDFGNMVRTPKERKMMSWLKNHPSQSLLFHHRFPTSTPNVKSSCHPFSTYQYFGDTQYILVHNGYLYNEDLLRQNHSSVGIAYSSERDGLFNDSESLLWDVALYLEGKQTELKSNGAVAFVCLKKSPEGNKLYFGRNSGSPLNMSKNNKYFLLSSEGRGKPIDTDTLYCYDYATGQLTTEKLEIPSSYGDTSYGGYSGYNAWGHKYPVVGTGYIPYKWDDEYEEETKESTPVNASELLAMDTKISYDDYLTRAKGDFTIAYEDVMEDIRSFDGYSDKGVQYEVDILNAVLDIIIEASNGGSIEVDEYYYGKTHNTKLIGG